VSSLPQPAIYLDPSVIGEALQGDMRPRDRAALCRLAAMVGERLLRFYAPARVRGDIERTSAKYRERYPREYAALLVFQQAEAGWLTGEPSATRDLQPDYISLKRLLGDETDARDLLQAKSAGVRDLVAADSSPLRARAEELETQVGLRVFRPADYLSRWSTQQRLPG
jgi:hypothetical protein